MNSRPYLKSINFKNKNLFNSVEYPFSIPSVQDIEKIEFHADVTFFVGENGSGKSTILEAIALALGFNEEGGTKNVYLNTASSVSELHNHLRLIKSFKKPRDSYFLRAESFYNVASYMDEVGYLGEYGGKSLHHRSHGESFMTCLIDKFKGNGLYILDEPEAALSPARLLFALCAIDQLVKLESQFIIATHSPILLSYPNARILEFSETGINEISYEETEHFRITRDFLNNYPKRLDQLLGEKIV